jgi:hypothetical protein
VPTAPTGTVFNIANTSGAFPVTGGTSRFLFATEHGQILGWPGSGAAQLSVGQSFAPGAIYKGLAIATTPAGPRLYATAPTAVDVWDARGTVNRRRASSSDDSRGRCRFGIQRTTSSPTWDADAGDVYGQGAGFASTRPATCRAESPAL